MSPESHLFVISLLIFRQRITASKSERYLIPNNGMSEEDDINGVETLCIDDSDVESIDLNEDDKPLYVNTKPLTQRASNDIVFVEQIDDNFNNIIETIKTSNCVGFALFGEEVTREGSVDLMSFGTPEAIYVFDANDEEMVSKIKPLIESKDLQKVMFALRLPSDALYHLFDIQLENAVDVRIWDYHYQRKLFISAEKSAKPDLRSYETLLWRYLSIKVPNIERNIDYSKFTIKVQNLIRIKTIFLRELFAIINFKLLEDVYRMTNRCIRSLRSAEGLEYFAVKSDECELEIIENPINEYEEMERKVIGLSSLRAIDDSKLLIGRDIATNPDEEIILDSDEEIGEIVVRLQTK